MSDALNWSTVSAAIWAWVVAGSGLDGGNVFWSYEGKPRPTAPYIEMTIQQVRGVGHDWSTSEANPLVFADKTVIAVSTIADTLSATAHGLTNGDGPVQLSSTVSLPAPLLAATDYWVILVDANTIKLATTYEHTGGQMPLGVGNTITPIDLTTAGSGTIKISSTGDTVKAGQEIVRRAQGFREVTIHLDCFAAEGRGYDAMRILTNVISSLQLHLYELDQAGVGVSDLGQASSQGGVQHLEGRRGSILEPRSMIDLSFYLASDLTGFDTIISTVEASIELVREDGVTSIPAIPVRTVLP